MLLWYRLLLEREQLPTKVISGEGTLLAAEERSARVGSFSISWYHEGLGFLPSFCSATSVCCLFLIGWLLSWLLEASYCSCRHTSNTSEKDKDRSLSCELIKNERNILRSPCRLPLIFHWPELGYMPIPKPPHVEENAVTRGGLLVNSSKFFLLSETSGWGVGSIQVPPRHMASRHLNKGKVSFAR